MKFQNLSKVSPFLACFVFCFLFLVPVSGAEQSDKELSRQIFSMESPGTLKGSLRENVITPVVQSVAAARDLASSFDVKIALSERVKAFLSLGELKMKDVIGKEIDQNYNAVFGFQVMLR